MVRIYRDEWEGIPVDAVIERILKEAKTVAVVGISDKPYRPSHVVARYLKERGYRIIPVNPRIGEVLGETAYRSLSDVPGRVDLVDVFRRSEEVPALAEEAIRIGARFFWMQEGVVSESARERLEGAGIPTVMDLCVKKELAKRGK
jgi:predicted CoA-binding protein